MLYLGIESRSEFPHHCYGVVAMPDAFAELLASSDCSPAPDPAVAECVQRLDATGFCEGPVRDFSPVARRYTVRGEGRFVASEVGIESPSAGGSRAVGTHTDSPELRLEPDVANPRLSMNSCGELAGIGDVAPMVEVRRLFYAS
ncbi:MAG: hypothetical protein CL938_02300 [Deltaproteobacteria bacterium]|nr:hypothetical protein [Deltaproteobacteria bacterium]